MPEINDQIQQEKIEARKWYQEHKSELPAEGYRGMGDDKYTEYLRKAARKVKDSNLKLTRESFGGQDVSPESTLSNLLEDCGTLQASDTKDRITSTAEYNLSQRDDYTENGLTREDVIARIVNRFGESIACYFRYCIDREKCKDIAPTIKIYGRSGVRTWKPAIIKRQALAVEKWVLALQMPLEEKAKFLGELRQAVETERKEISWRGSPELEKADRWAQLFAAVEPPKLWWERRRPEIPTEPQYPDWYEVVLPRLAGKHSLRWVLIAGPALSGNVLPDSPLPVSTIKELAGGRTWQNSPVNINSHYLGSFGLLRPEESAGVRAFILSQRPSPTAAEFKPLPPISEKPFAKLVIKPERRSARQLQKLTAEARKAEKRRQVENGLIRVLDSNLPASDKREFVRITDLFSNGNTVKEIARRTKLSVRTVNTRIAALRSAA